MNKIRESGDTNVIYLYPGIILTETLPIFTIERVHYFLFISRNIEKKKGMSPFSLIPAV